MSLVDTPMPAQGQALIEVLLAAAIGVVLAAALTQIFVGTSRSQAATASRAAVQESARHALAFLRRSARSAGYLGCGVDGGLTSALNGTSPPSEIALAPAVAGFDGRARAWRPPLSALPAKGGGAPAFKSRNRLDAARLRPGSDVVVFRRTEVGVPLAQPMRRGGDPVAGLDPNRALAGVNFAVVSTCRQAALFRATSSRASAGVTRLRHTAGNGPFANRPGARLATALPYGGGGGPAGARVGQPLAEIYFVGRRARDARDPTWGLWRKTGVAAPAELVAGIENLQLLFGVDTVPGDGDRAPQRYVTADAVAGGAIRSLRIAITAVAPAPAGAALRRTFTQTVALRN